MGVISLQTGHHLALKYSMWAPSGTLTEPDAHAADRLVIASNRRAISRTGCFLIVIGSTPLAVDLFKDWEQDLVVRKLVQIVDMLVSDDALFVHDEDGSLREALRAQNAILLGYLAMGPEVTEQGDLAGIERFCPRRAAGRAVYANTQNLGIYRLEAL